MIRHDHGEVNVPLDKLRDIYEEITFLHLNKSFNFSYLKLTELDRGMRGLKLTFAHKTDCYLTVEWL